MLMMPVLFLYFRFGGLIVAMDVVCIVKAELPWALGLFSGFG